jgi:adenine deaminase
LQERSLTPENIALLRELQAEQLARVLFVTDDFSPSAFARGHLVSNLRKAIALGLPPLEALASATVRPARLMGLSELGAVAPGRHADFFLTPDLRALPITRVFIGGDEVAAGGEPRGAWLGQSGPAAGLTSPGRVPARLPVASLSPEDFAFRGADGVRRCHLMASNGRNNLTTLQTAEIGFIGGRPALPAGLALVGVFERHGVNGQRALGFLDGYGHLDGAVAATVAHDCHNLVVLGRDPQDMALAGNHLVEQGGGLVVVRRGAVAAFVPLPIAGLLSDAPVTVLKVQFDHFEAALTDLGVRHQQGLMFLTMVTLTTSPHIKLSDRGLVDVDSRRIIPVII